MTDALVGLEGDTGVRLFRRRPGVFSEKPSLEANRVQAHVWETGPKYIGRVTTVAATRGRQQRLLTYCTGLGTARLRTTVLRSMWGPDKVTQKPLRNDPHVMDVLTSVYSLSNTRMAAGHGK